MVDKIVAPSNPEGKSSISNTTMVILVIVAVLITAIGTWAVLSGVGSNQGEMQESSNTNVGIVTLTILPSEQPQDSDGGKVTLNVT